MKSPKVVITIVAGAIFYFFLALMPLLHQGVLYLPPLPGDGPDYENIAWNISNGHGYGFSFGDPEWRSFYESYNERGLYDELLTRQGEYSPTTSRPPLVPYVIAALYKIFGRDLSLWRLLNGAVVSIGVGLCMLISFSLGGWPALLTTMVIAFADNTLRWYVVPLVTTEGFSFLFVSCLVAMLIFTKRDMLRSVSFGVLLTLLLYTRSAFVFWLPFAIAAWCLLGEQHAHWQKRLITCLVVSVTVVLMYLPFAWRNIEHTEGFHPFGLQGVTNLPVAYSDAAIKTDGLWNPVYFAEVYKDFAGKDHSLVLERERAAHGKQVFREWLSERAGALPELFWLRVSSLWWKHALHFQQILVVLTLCGLLATAFTPQAKIFFLLFCAQSFAVALTWNVIGGRFLIPLHGLFYLLAGLFVAKLFSLRKEMSPNAE